MKKIVITLLALVLTLPVFSADKDYTFLKLKSGQTVVVKQVPNNPIVTIDTWIRTGSINETEKNSGVAHFLEHLFFKGTEKTPPGEFDRILESKGGVTNAATSKDFTHYYITLPSKDFDLAMNLHSDMLLHPMIPRKELEKERPVVLEEIGRSNDSPQSILYSNLFKTLYGNFKPEHPYYREVLGSSKVIETISREEIFEFYNKWYTPDNMVTVVVGDVEPSHAIKKIEELFVQPAGHKTPVVTYPVIQPVQSQMKINAEKDVKTGYILVAYRAPKFKDDKDGYALDVLATLFGESRSSRLNQSLKEKKQLVYNASAGVSAFMDDGLFTVNATFEPSKLNVVENEIYAEVEKLKTGDITTDEIAKAKNMIKTSTYYSRESISNISNEMGYYTLFWGNMDFYDNYLNNIDKVTKADLIRVAKKYLVKEHSVVSTVMPPSNPLKEVANVTPSNKTYTSKVIEKSDKVTKYELENGAILIIKKNTANSIIAMDIESKGGEHIEKMPAIGDIAASTATKGTEKYTDEKFAQALDENGVKLSLSSGADTFGINLLTTKNELKFALSMLDEAVNRPNFATSDIEKIKKLKLAGIKSMQDNPLNLAIDEFKGIAFKGTTYANTASVIEKHIPHVTRDEVKDFYNTMLEPKNLVITIVGDVNENEMIQEVSKIFQPKNLKAYNLKDFTKKTFVPTENINKVITKKDTQTAWILVGYKTTDVYNSKDIATLKVINAILGEGMSSRLFKSLRENQGLAYSVGSTVAQNALDGSFIAYIGTNNKNVDVAKKGMITEIGKLKSEFVPQKELDEAKDKILGNLLVSLETNMDDATLYGWYGALGYDLNHLEEYKKSIQSVTASDVLAVANKYFSTPYISVVVKKE